MPWLELGVWSLRHKIFLSFETKIRNLKVKFNQKRIQLKSILRNQDFPKKLYQPTCIMPTRYSLTKACSLPARWRNDS